VKKFANYVKHLDKDLHERGPRARPHEGVHLELQKGLGDEDVYRFSPTTTCRSLVVRKSQIVTRSLEDV
jgi:hypothetical protein